MAAVASVVNTAARAQPVAASDGILVTEAVYQRAGRALAGSRRQDYDLKGDEKPVRLYAV